MDKFIRKQMEDIVNYLGSKDLSDGASVIQLAAIVEALKESSEFLTGELTKFEKKAAKKLLEKYYPELTSPNNLGASLRAVTIQANRMFDEEIERTKRIKNPSESAGRMVEFKIQTDTIIEQVKELLDDLKRSQDKVVESVLGLKVSLTPSNKEELL